MATYLVRQRIKEAGQQHFPGAVLQLDPAAKATQILIQRNMIVPVPADYPTLQAAAEPELLLPEPAAAEPEAFAPEVSETDEAPAPEAEHNDIEELLSANTREELDKMALEAGVDSPESLPNKRAVATAIVAALEA